MMTVDSLRFYPADFELRERDAMRRGSMNPAGVAQSVQFGVGAIRWPFDLTRPEEVREFYGRQCAENGGAMIGVEVIALAGFEALGGVFKYRSPEPGSLGMYYVSILWLPFRNCWFQVNIEALERGMTGVREAVLMLAEPDAWPKTEGEPRMLAEGVDFATRLRRNPPSRLPSDDPKYDEKFPDHPLSLVRRRSLEIIGSAEFDDAEARNLRPFRIKRGPWWRRG